ncbi:DUF2806 domain-containing protein [Neptunomonas phycophila]|uniref:DUF2806 domain-containing protein n=1 Tax=Neptunomonas phycophila TaxID=1572645 RepID=UPI0026E19889|nr:DUF2806 domain-containing protein [Neptunomonas phycophila]MDO6783526.1 DUF2806 domain-containing protein [Neptunomonas phycophila]
MSEGNSLVNFGDLSKPATVLIEKVSNAVGVLYEPRRIKKKAEAEAEAEKIKALASIELSDIQQRAIDRMVQQEGRKQENIEAITAQAVSSLAEDADVQNLEEDWVAHFFKNCDTVSDTEMQSLWSRLLSGEASKPGTFSKRTVDFVASMDKKDAEIFTKFCQFSWFLGDVMPIIIDPDNNIYKNEGINFSVLKHLDAIGLISFESTSGYRRMGFGKHTQIFYFGRPTVIEFPKNSDNELNIGKVLLTRAGQELAPICGAQRNEKFYEYVIEQWFNSRLITHTPLLNK